MLLFWISWDSSREFQLANAFFCINVNQAFSTMKVSSCNTQPFREICLKINNKMVLWPAISCVAAVKLQSRTLLHQGRAGEVWPSAVSWSWAGGEPQPREQPDGGRAKRRIPPTPVHSHCGVNCLWDKSPTPSEICLAGVVSWNLKDIIHRLTQVAPRRGLQSSSFSPTVRRAGLGTFCAAGVSLAQRWPYAWFCWGSAGKRSVTPQQLLHTGG